MTSHGILTEKQCDAILQAHLKTDKSILKSFTIQPTETQFDGLVGEQYVLKIFWEAAKANSGTKLEKVLQLFVKILNGKNPVMFGLAKSIFAFEKEQFFYETIVPLFEASGIQMQFLPKSYLCENYTIVLEDLKQTSFRGALKNQPLDVTHCKVCLNVLAQFHTALLVYEIKQKEHDINYEFYVQYKDILRDRVFCDEENGATRFMKHSFEGLFSLIDLMPENGNFHNKADFKKKLETIILEIMSSNDQPIELKCTLLHGDLWSNNFLFKYDEQHRPTAAKLIDYQTLKYGPPALDILEFIFTNTRKTFRDVHQTALLNYYYTVFTEQLAAFSVDAGEVLSKEEFATSCELMIVPAKIGAIVDRCITCTSEELYAEVEKSPEVFSNFLYEGRSDYIKKGFENNKGFREQVLEDLNELYLMIS